jgi:hypothetical protein
VAQYTSHTSGSKGGGVEHDTVRQEETVCLGNSVQGKEVKPDFT